MKNVVCLGVLVLVCPACVNDASQPVVGPPDVPVYDGPSQELDDPDPSTPAIVDDSPPAVADFFEVGFIDRDGPVVADPADPDIPISENFVVLLRTDDGTIHRATDAGMAAQSVRFVPLMDPANPGPGDGNAVVYDALPILTGGRNATGSFTLTDLDAALDNSMTPLLSLATPDNVDIDPAGQRVIACGVNFSPCPCCGVRSKAHILSLAGGVDQALEDALNEALAMQLMTGATECQWAMDGSVVYAAGKDMNGNPALVRAMLGAGAVMAEPVPGAGSQGVQSFDISPDGMKIVFINPLGAGGGVTVRDLEGEMMPFALSEPAVDIGEDWAARRMHKSPRWCDDTHVVWQTFDGTRRTVYMGDTETRERIDLWSDENRVPLSESWIDCRIRQE